MALVLTDKVTAGTSGVALGTARPDSDRTPTTMIKMFVFAGIDFDIVFAYVSM